MRRLAQSLNSALPMSRSIGSGLRSVGLRSELIERIAKTPMHLGLQYAHPLELFEEMHGKVPHQYCAR